MRPIIAIALLSLATWYCARLALTEQRRAANNAKEDIGRWESEGGASVPPPAPDQRE